MKTIEQRVLDVVRNPMYFEPRYAIESLALQTKFDDLGLDSLDMVEMVMALEDSFGMEIPDEAISNIVTIGDAVDLVTKYAEVA